MKKILDEVLSIDEKAYAAIMEAYPDGLGNDFKNVLKTLVSSDGNSETDIVKGMRLIGRGYGNIADGDDRFSQGQIVVTSPVVDWRVFEGKLAKHPFVRVEDGGEYEVIELLACSQYCNELRLTELCKDLSALFAVFGSLDS